jgi:hypothetical protein
MSPLEATLHVVPRGRVDLIDIRALAADAYDRAFETYARCALLPFTRLRGICRRVW